ncbi:MAG: hypothetical protein J6S06_01940 [Alphaproteobacteria bacterium]|nr:hypothetical protein [Alphaproteobacteria bacterium]
MLGKERRGKMDEFKQNVILTYEQAVDLNRKNPKLVPGEVKITIACTKAIIGAMNVVEKIAKKIQQKVK